jgi:hypothetical protein
VRRGGTATSARPGDNAHAPPAATAPRVQVVAQTRARNAGGQGVLSVLVAQLATLTGANDATVQRHRAAIEAALGECESGGGGGAGAWRSSHRQFSSPPPFPRPRAVPAPSSQAPSSQGCD